jgi:hypothetical protein
MSCAGFVRKTSVSGDSCTKEAHDAKVESAERPSDEGKAESGERLNGARKSQNESDGTSGEGNRRGKSESC